METGFHRTFIGQVERGESNISIDNLERLADGLTMPAYDLLHPLSRRPEDEKRHRKTP